MSGPWPLFGYAPGHYMGTCVDCKSQIEADKRATQCLECAVKCAHSALTAVQKVRPTGKRFYVGNVVYVERTATAMNNYIESFVGWHVSEQDARGSWVQQTLDKHGDKQGGISSMVVTDVTHLIAVPA